MSTFNTHPVPAPNTCPDAESPGGGRPTICASPIPGCRESPKIQAACANRPPHTIEHPTELTTATPMRLHFLSMCSGRASAVRCVQQPPSTGSPIPPLLERVATDLPGRMQCPALPFDHRSLGRERVRVDWGARSSEPRSPSARYLAPCHCRGGGGHHGYRGIVDVVRALR